MTVLAWVGGLLLIAAGALWMLSRLPEPCNACRRGYWRWKGYTVCNDGLHQVIVRPFKWRWADVLARTSKLSAMRKMYSRWVLLGPLEIRVFTERSN